MSVVQLEDMGKTYGSVVALEDVTMEIGEGVTGLLGPNGAGKSTLLLCVLGLLPDWVGEVRVLDLDARTEQREIRRRVGFMPEADTLLPDMTGIRAVRHLGELAGLPRAEALRRAHEVLWHVGLGEAVYRDLREYSTGMRQRFKLAQALVHDPEVLFLDEPLGGLDPAGRDELLDLIRDLASNHHKHIVWSSHILPEVQKVADGVVILHQGRFRGSFQLAGLAAEGGRYLIEVEGDSTAFREAVASADIPLVPAQTGHGTDALLGRHAFTTTLGPEQDVGDLFRLARRHGVRLRKAAPLKEDLESVFHRLLHGAPEGIR